MSSKEDLEKRLAELEKAVKALLDAELLKEDETLDGFVPRGTYLGVKFE